MATSGNFALLGVTAVSPDELAVRYRFDDEGGAPPAEIALTVYRSADRMLDPGDLAVGSSTIMVTPTGGDETAVIRLASPLGILPERPHVLVAAGGDADTSDNLASFRKWTVGVVTHGFQPDGRMPSWVHSTAATLRGQGYDAALPYNWAAASRLPVEGITGLAGRRLAARIGDAVRMLPAHGFRRGDVIDLHLIGHSRGGGVVNTAASALTAAPALFSSSFVKVTMLDPHPARNTTEVPYYSASLGPVGVLSQLNFVAFQQAANDPPLELAPNVRQLEVFHQSGTVADPSPLLAADERFVHSWGEVPVAIPDGAIVTDVAYYDLNAIVPSHAGVYTFYQQVVAPTLGRGIPLDQLGLPLVASPTADPPPGGGFLPGTGFESELQLLTAAGLPAPVGSALLGEVATLNAAIAEGDLGSARMQVRRVARLVLHQIGPALPAESTASFTLLLGSTARLLR